MWDLGGGGEGDQDGKNTRTKWRVGTEEERGGRNSTGKEPGSEWTRSHDGRDEGVSVQH